MQTDLYTNGIDIISIIKKERSSYLVKDAKNQTLILSNLKGYRKIGDSDSIKQWYQDSKRYLKKHPIAAFIAGLAVFFGLINF